MKATENFKLIKDLQSLLKSKNYGEKALQNIGIDTTIKTQDFRNIRIKNDLWNGLIITIIDEKNDLNGNPISENKKLISRVKNLLENGTNKIYFTDLIDLDIITPAKEIVLGNIKLITESFLMFSLDYYDIQIIDEQKNIDGLWKDSAINTDKILKVLQKFDLTAEHLCNIKEIELNKEIELHFKSFFETVKKGGRSNQGDIDLILGSKQNYGIELKLARELIKASVSQKAIGQIEMYTRQFSGNFMLVVAGLSNEKNDKYVSEVVRKAKECKCAYFYMEVQ